MSHARSKPAIGAIEDPKAGIPIEQCLLVQDEIWRIVADAARSGSRLSLGKQARRIAGNYPAAGLALQSIMDALVYAAVDCGVAFEVAGSAARPTIDVPGLFAFVGKKRKSGAKTRPTFAGVPIPATT